MLKSVLKFHEKFSWKMLTWDNYFAIKISKYDSLVLKIIQNCYYAAFNALVLQPYYSNGDNRTFAIIS